MQGHSMQITSATAVIHDVGPLIRVVNEFTAAQAKVLAAGVKSAADWDPVAVFVDPVEFKRVGAYLEELNWQTYKAFLTGWAAGGTQFEMTIFHMTEAGNAVFQEIEERHRRGQEFIRKNVIAVYRFNAAGKIIHLDIYEQARDSGQWIVKAAEAAMSKA
jgi:limonene-1,2-epoxide hydrolase